MGSPHRGKTHNPALGGLHREPRGPRGGSMEGRVARGDPRCWRTAPSRPTRTGSWGCAVMAPIFGRCDLGCGVGCSLANHPFSRQEPPPSTRACLRSPAASGAGVLPTTSPLPKPRASLPTPHTAGSYAESRHLRGRLHLHRSLAHSVNTCAGGGRAPVLLPPSQTTRSHAQTRRHRCVPPRSGSSESRGNCFRGVFGVGVCGGEASDLKVRDAPPNRPAQYR